MSTLYYYRAAAADTRHSFESHNTFREGLSETTKILRFAKVPGIHCLRKFYTYKEVLL